MHDGRLSREQLQAWVANRWYYQTRIPIKDAVVLSKSEDPTFRRAWIRRIRLINWHGHENFAQPTRGFTLQDLHTIRSHLDLRVFADARDWCAALFAFFGLPARLDR